MSASAYLTDRPVLDADKERVGTIIGAEVSPRTHEARSLLIELEPELQQQLGLEEPAVWLPYSHVQAIRRNEVAINDTIRDLLLVPASLSMAPTEEDSMSTMHALVEADAGPVDEDPSPRE